MPQRYGTRRTGTGPTGIDPGTLPNLELRFRGTTLAGAADDRIATWVDISGYGRDGTQAVNGNRPRISGINSNNPNSPTGKLGAGFTFGEPDYLTGALPVGGIDDSAGFTFYAWIFESPFGGANQVVWNDPIGSRPQLIYSSANSKIGYRDDAATFETITMTSGYHSLAWTFAPPNDHSGVASVYQDGVLLGASTWNFTTNPATSYVLGANQVFNAGFAGIMYEFDFFSTIHSLSTINAIRRYGQSFWGF